MTDTPPDEPASPVLGHDRSTLQTRLARFEWVLYPLSVFAFSRAAILFVAHWSLRMDPRLHRGEGVLKTPALDSLCWWDCGWFTRIALDGYEQAHWTNFFPLFPLAGRVVHTVTGLSVPYSLILVSNLCALGAAILVYRIFERLEGAAVARAGLTLWVAWPFAFFHATGYPESLMSLTTAGAILLAMNRRHVLAGIVLGTGFLGRHLTMIGGTALLAEQLQQRGIHPRRFIWHPAFLGLVAPFAVGGVYLAYQYARFGDALSFLHARSTGWGNAAWFGLPHFFLNAHAPEITSYVILSVIPGIGALVLWSRRKWWTLGAYGLSLMVVLWAIGLMGLGRYTGSCWPAFLPLGLLVTRYPWLRLPAVLAFAVMQGMYLYLFTHSYPIN